MFYITERLTIDAYSSYVNGSFGNIDSPFSGQLREQFKLNNMSPDHDVETVHWKSKQVFKTCRIMHKARNVAMKHFKTD